MRKAYTLEIRGKFKEWVFVVYEDPRYLADWQTDGLAIEEIANIVPEWWVRLGLPVGWWCRVQDWLK